MHPIRQQHSYRLRKPNTDERLICLFALLAVLAFCAAVQPCDASSGDITVVPFTRAGKPTFSTQSGLQIQVDSIWSGNRGYRPVRVTASTLKPATADTQITINFRAGNWQNDHRGISVEQDFELSRDATNSTVIFSVPQYVDWNSTSWDVWVDGVKDEQLCSQRGFSSGTPGAVSVGVFETGRWSWSADPAFLLHSILGSNIDKQIFDSSSLPSRWIDYSPLDVLVSTTGSLEMLRVISPEKLAELLRWVRSGGNLWIMDIGTDFSVLPDLEKLLAPDFGGMVERKEKPLSDWHFLKPNENGRHRLNDLAKMTMQIPEEGSSPSIADSIQNFDPDLADDSDLWNQLFVVRVFGMGTVVACRDINIKGDSKSSPNLASPLSENEYGEGENEYGGFEGEEELGSRYKIVAHYRNASISQNLDWATRHGNDPAGGNPNFNNLLIPDVGAAPVFEFQLLISLFVIGIGPVNYWLLKRRNQLPLLLVTVPVAALVATLMLFTYGLLADGIGVRVRVRSMTTLDQRTGEVASWARLSYYAGIAPSEGLQMPVDTVIYPILPSHSENSTFGRRRINQQRSLEWNQQQQLTRGWLGSRTPTQYLAITARPTKKHLQFVAKPEQFSVSNHLGTQMLALVVQDQEGNVFVGNSLNAESSAELTPTTYAKAASVIRKLLAENLPQLPAGYVESKRSRRSRFSNDYGISMTDSLMELHFEAIVSPVATGWGNGTYLAITSTGIEVPLGVDEVSETCSFHIVRGTW